MQITQQSTINDVLKAHPQTLKVFYQYKLDVCCGGAKTLAAAAKEKGFDVATLVTELQALAGQ